MFRKLIAIEPLHLNSSAEQTLFYFATEVILYDDIPENDDEIILRIGDADAVLLGNATQIHRNTLEKCPHIRYIGICSPLHSHKNANVDIPCAEERGITVTSIRNWVNEDDVKSLVSDIEPITSELLSKKVLANLSDYIKTQL